jgi:hypothetical protein
MCDSKAGEVLLERTVWATPDKRQLLFGSEREEPFWPLSSENDPFHSRSFIESGVFLG